MTTTALLMIDMQKMYLEQHKRDVFGWPPIWRLEEVTEECRRLLAAARTRGIPVIYTRAVGRPDGADAMPSMRRLMATVSPDGASPIADRTAASEILDAVAPEPGDIVLDKLRWDAFHFTELEPILRNLGARRLIIAGLQTNVCIETTARTAMMRNFEVAVPEDAVSTDGVDLHFNALNSMRVLYVEIAPWRELLAPDAAWDRAFTTPGYGRSDPATTAFAGTGPDPR
ncbi:cysteine hydrolase family protein [Dactylosporangium sp. CA-092794]|uniref:cysteine hydrolase family protein n=1 Tax=Dactylosporangium sp. CA-092794 TaxID=3239929 RepID=UPI003D90AA78